MPCPDCRSFPGPSDVATILDSAVLPPIKPPAQVAGVSGIAPTPVTMHQQSEVPWATVVHLPPFQMFAAEKMRNTSGKDALEHAADYVRQKGGGADVFEAYAAWHTEKGYWPNETPMGEVK